MKDIIQYDIFVLKQYKQLKHFKYQESLNEHTVGLYNFLLNNFHFIFGPRENTIFVEVVEERIVVGFITSAKDLYDNYFISSINLNKKDYYIFANEFLCISPKNIRIFLIIKLMREQKFHFNQTAVEVYNFCHPDKSTYIMSGGRTIKYGSFEFKFTNDVKSVGEFDLEKCTHALKEIIDELPYRTKTKSCNLAELKTKIIPNNISYIKLHNELFTMSSLTHEDFLKTLHVKIIENCFPSKFTLFNNNSFKKQNTCFYTVLLHNLFKFYIWNNSTLRIVTKLTEPYQMYSDIAFIYGDPLFDIQHAYKPRDKFRQPIQLNLSKITKNSDVSINFKVINKIFLSLIVISGIILILLLASLFILINTYCLLF